MSIGFAGNNYIFKSTFVKQNKESLLYVSWSWTSEQYQCFQWDLMTAWLCKQWFLKCTWSNMSAALVSYKVIKVAICLQCLGEEIDFFLCSHQKNPFYSSKLESTELHQRQHSERGLRLFFDFSQRLALFPANKAGPRCKSVKDFVVSHLGRGLNYTSLPVWPRDRYH